MLEFLIEQCQKEQHDLYEQEREHDREINRLKKLDFIDEDKSVKWNREEIQRRIHSEQVKKELIKKSYASVMDPVIEWIKKDIKEAYQFSDEIIDIIYDQAYCDGHSDGYYNVYSFAKEYAEFALRIIELSKN